MKLTVSRMATINIPDGVNQETINRIVSSASTNLASTMQLLGLSRVSVGIIRTLSTESHVVSSYDFFNGVPDGIKKIAQRTVESIGTIMSGFGVGSIEMSPDDGDEINLHSVWESLIAEPVVKTSPIGPSRDDGPGSPMPPDPVSGTSETIPSRTVGCDQKSGCSCHRNGVIRL